jgi:hypothetical protein
MIDDLHRSIWLTYRHAIGADASWDARAAFQVALDVFLDCEPEYDAVAACREVARMIMMRPRGIANGGRVVAAALAHDRAPDKLAAMRSGPIVAVARFVPARAAMSGRR